MPLDPAELGAARLVAGIVADTVADPGGEFTMSPEHDGFRGTRPLPAAAHPAIDQDGTEATALDLLAGAAQLARCLVLELARWSGRSPLEAATGLLDLVDRHGP